MGAADTRPGAEAAGAIEEEQVTGSIPAPTFEPEFVRPLRTELQRLAQQRWFWIGLGLKLVLAALLGGQVATQQFGSFLYHFVQNPLQDPFAFMIERGQADAFPYGPVMVVYLAISWLPAVFVDFDPGQNLGLFLLRLPILGADVLICALLLRWLRIRPHLVVWMYWLSPILIYATYIHGQLDLVPTALLCLTLFLIFTRHPYAAGVAFALGLGTKLHLLIALPFLAVYLYRVRRFRRQAYGFIGLSLGLTALLYAFPLTSPAFRRMVLDTPQSEKLWSVFVPYGAGQPSLYVAPMVLLLGLLTFAGYRKVNKEVTLMFLGAMYVALMAFVPPQPGWFLWSLPFVAYMGAQFNRTRRIHIAALTLAYLAYFSLARPEEFLGAFDPIFGDGFGFSATLGLQRDLPGLFGPRMASLAFTVLFCTTVVTALEMFRRGVSSNAVYTFRDQSFMIGIGGDSGAGKHTIGADLAKLMGAHLSTLHGDDDHKWERGHEGWKTFTHLDPRANLLMQQFDALASLRRGGWIEKRHYDHDVGRFTDPLEIEDNSFISIIGLHPFYLPSQRQLMDLKVFVQPEESVRRHWKVSRDMAKRGYTEERVLAQIEARMPDSEKYVLPQAKYADVLIRHRAPDTRNTDRVDLEIEINAELASLRLVDAVDRLEGLEVEWSPDPDLTRDKIGLTGFIDAEGCRELAAGLVPNLDEMIENEHWERGGGGLVQVVLLHAISVRLRTEGGPR